MRNKKIITLATLVAVVALAISLPVFASGCDDDDLAYGGRMAQQVQERDGDCDGNGECLGDGSGRGMGRFQGQNADRDGICDDPSDCPGLGNGLGNGDCDGDGDCDGECLGTEGRIGAGDKTDSAGDTTSDSLPSCCQ